MSPPVQIDLFDRPASSRDELPPHLAHLRPPMPFIEALQLLAVDMRRRYPDAYRQDAS